MSGIQDDAHSLDLRGDLQGVPKRVDERVECQDRMRGLQREVNPVLQRKGSDLLYAGEEPEPGLFPGELAPRPGLDQEKVRLQPRRPTTNLKSSGRSRSRSGPRLGYTQFGSGHSFEDSRRLNGGAPS